MRSDEEGNSRCDHYAVITLRVLALSGLLIIKLLFALEPRAHLMQKLDFYEFTKPERSV